jgi:hypothetical protein
VNDTAIRGVLPKIERYQALAFERAAIGAARVPPWRKIGGAKPAPVIADGALAWSFTSRPDEHRRKISGETQAVAVREPPFIEAGISAEALNYRPRSLTHRPS